MKREIVCAHCAEEWRKLVGKYEGENIRVLEGAASSDMRCDGCNVHLEQGDTCYGVSVWVDPTPEPLCWESRHMVLDVPLWRVSLGQAGVDRVVLIPALKPDDARLHVTLAGLRDIRGIDEVPAEVKSRVPHAFLRRVVTGSELEALYRHLRDAT